MEATIVEIMESWPLQLAVEIDGRRLHVQLAADAVVYDGPREVAVGTLSPGDRIDFDFAGSLTQTPREIKTIRLQR